MSMSPANVRVFYLANLDDLNQACHICHKLNVEAGWWNDPVTGAYVGRESYLFPYFVSTKIALMHSELSEALEAVRKNKKEDDHLPERSGFEVEMADLFIRMMDLAGALDIDLRGAIADKAAYNMTRQDHTTEERAKKGGKIF